MAVSITLVCYGHRLYYVRLLPSGQHQDHIQYNSPFVIANHHWPQSKLECARTGECRCPAHVFVHAICRHILHPRSYESTIQEVSAVVQLYSHEYLRILPHAQDYGLRKHENSHHQTDCSLSPLLNRLLSIYLYQCCACEYAAR